MLNFKEKFSNTESCSLAQRHRDILAKLDPIAVSRYQITEKDIQTIEEYLQVIQRGLQGGSTWQDINQYDQLYATSVVIHEIVEIRVLQRRGFNPLRRRTKTLRRLVIENIEAHVRATYEEHLYLQEAIRRVLGFKFEVATLIYANRGDDDDLQLFLESDFGIYRFEEDRVAEAEQVIAQLKGEERI